ncbi:MAG: hypothetical protein AABW65_02190 [Nanoarchaeota archaeon]
MTEYYRLNLTRSEDGLYYLKFRKSQGEKIFRSYDGVINYLKTVNPEKLELNPIFIGFSTRLEIKKKLEAIINERKKAVINRQQKIEKI